MQYCSIGYYNSINMPVANVYTLCTLMTAYVLQLQNLGQPK